MLYRTCKIILGIIRSYELSLISNSVSMMAFHNRAGVKHREF